MSIIHVFRGCHVWTIGSRDVGPVTTVRTKPGARIKLRLSCPMDFDVTQTAGPKLVLGGRRFYAGTTRTIFSVISLAGWSRRLITSRARSIVSPWPMTSTLLLVSCVST